MFGRDAMWSLLLLPPPGVDHGSLGGADFDHDEDLARECYTVKIGTFFII